MSLQFGGQSVQFTKDIGTAAAVQGFRATGAIFGGSLTAALATTVLMQVAQRAIQFAIVSVVVSQIWIKVSGVWKQATPWIKVAGVWKQAVPWIKNSGVWK